MWLASPIVAPTRPMMESASSGAAAPPVATAATPATTVAISAPTKPAILDTQPITPPALSLAPALSQLLIQSLILASAFSF